MKAYDKYTLESLEFARIREEVSKLCLSDGGQAHSQALRPSTDSLTIETRLDETSEMKELCEFEEPIPLERQDKLKVLLGKLKVEGATFDPEQLKQLSRFQQMILALSQYRKNKENKYKHLDAYLEQLKPLNELILRIDKAIDHANEVKDSASDALRRIRREKVTARAQVMQKLNQALSKKGHRPGHQDDIITMREGRYVIAIVDSDYDPNSAVIHDRSRTGTTLYVEPTSAIDLNNKLRRLNLDEQHEIERILQELSAFARGHNGEIERNAELYWRLDFLHAKARFAARIEGTKPKLINRPVISLQAAFHPLLLLKSSSRADVVPLSVELGYNHDIVIITGPNTGGKTVALKTVGLLALMVQSGLLISADENSEFGAFDKIFADIGDEQSIELSLSTYSAHVARVTAAITGCNDRSLLLFDELGVGTDPKEGAALAESIIEYISETGAKCVVTTHYSALKAVAQAKQRIENASLEFDSKTLQPTYKFRTGLPGSSYALDVAARLGMPKQILSKARDLVGTQERSLADLISKLENDLMAADAERRNLEEKLKTASELEQFHQSQRDKVERREEKLLREGYDEALRLIESTRRQVDQMMAKIKSGKPTKDVVQKARKSLEDLRKELTEQRPSAESQSPPGKPPVAGDRVYMPKLQTEGDLTEVFPDGKRGKVRIGKVFYTVDINDLQRLEAKAESTPARDSISHHSLTDDFSPEISLRGLTVEEARSALDKYFDEIALAHVPSIRIVHGKGTGALKRFVREYLSQNRMVDSFKLGEWNEGSWGVTIVKLKD